jgi:hypothetical protein
VEVGCGVIFISKKNVFSYLSTLSCIHTLHQQPTKSSSIIYRFNKYVICNDKTTRSVVFMFYSYAGQPFMKFKTTILALALTTVSSFTIGVYGQSQPLLTRDEHQHLDSLETAQKANQAQLQDEKDKDNLSDMRKSKRETKAKAKEAQRLESDANDAARQSKNAYKTEKRAQKARKQADRQSRKATEAKRKSDNN